MEFWEIMIKKTIQDLIYSVIIILYTIPDYNDYILPLTDFTDNLTKDQDFSD